MASGYRIHLCGNSQLFKDSYVGLGDCMVDGFRSSQLLPDRIVPVPLSMSIHKEVAV